MFFNEKVKIDIVKFGTKVTFDKAYEYLTKGYIIRSCNDTYGYFIMIENEIYHIGTNSDDACYKVTEFTAFDMKHNWIILEPLKQKDIKK